MVLIVDRDNQCFWEPLPFPNCENSKIPYKKINWNNSDREYFSAIDKLNKKISDIETPFYEKQHLWMGQLITELQDSLEDIQFTKEEYEDIYIILWKWVHYRISKEMEDMREANGVDTWQYYKELAILSARHRSSQ